MCFDFETANLCAKFARKLVQCAAKALETSETCTELQKIHRNPRKIAKMPFVADLYTGVSLRFEDVPFFIQGLPVRRRPESAAGEKSTPDGIKKRQSTPKYL